MARRPSKCPTKVLDFEALRGLRVRHYIRESSPRQAKADRYGPHVQRAAINAFCERWGVTSEHEYFDAYSGRRMTHRTALKSALAEAEEYDVLLFFMTSRSFRNRHDSTIWKERFREAGITLIFTQQGIISGHPRHKMLEGFNEVIDEAYSDTMGEWIAGGLRQKFERGGVNGVPPLGYKRYHGEDGDPLNGSLVVDERGKATVRAVVALYLTAGQATATIARTLNQLAGEDGRPLHRTRLGDSLTKGSVEEILRNRTYIGKSVWRPGTPDEEVRDGTHQPLITQDEWEQITAQRERRTRRRGRRPMSRSYPLSGPARCYYCRATFAGDTGGRRGKRRLRHAVSIVCENRRSFSAEVLEQQTADLLGQRFAIPADWQSEYRRALSEPARRPDSSLDSRRLTKALDNLQELYKWGDKTRAQYVAERDALREQLRALGNSSPMPRSFDSERAATLLDDVGQLWLHPGISDQTRKAFIDEVFEEVLLDQTGVRRVTPRAEYLALIAISDVAWGGYGRGDWI